MPLFNASAFEEAMINAFVHNRWLDGNAPMFTAYQDRIEILSRGNLPPKQTLEGFFAGESVPVNQALSDVFIKLHITEHTGRGVPRITEAYGKDAIRFNENSIVVTIPFERLGAEVYEGGHMNPPIITPVEDEIPQVSGQIPQAEGEIPPVIPPVEDEIPQVNPQVEKYIPQVNVSVDDRILNFCMIAKSINDVNLTKSTENSVVKPNIRSGPHCSHCSIYKCYFIPHPSLQLPTRKSK